MSQAFQERDFRRHVAIVATEDMLKYKIDEAKKKVVNQELTTTTALGDKIGKDKAAKVIKLFMK